MAKMRASVQAPMRVTFGTPVVTGALASPTAAREVVFALTTRARVVSTKPSPDVPVITQRLSAGVMIAMAEPLVSQGRAVLPAYRAAATSTTPAGAAQAGAGHIRVLADPDPVWNAAQSAWDVPPPDMPAGTKWARWSAKTLPDPSTFPDSEYALGALSSVDGTDAQASGTAYWAVSPGSDFSINWNSAYPFKPMVRQHLHYGVDNSRHLEAAGVVFNASFVRHMWADFGTVLTPPFSVVIVALITHFAKGENSFVFDAGNDPTAAMTATQRLHALQHGMVSTFPVSEADSYRNMMRIDAQKMHVSNRADGSGAAKTPYVHQHKPKMSYMVIDGASSLIGTMATAGKHMKSATMANLGPQRLWLMGRKTGTLDRDYASDMVVFEVRVFDHALQLDHLAKQYDQLSTTWRFHDYH